MKNTYQFISDPGHGWLEVGKLEAKRLKVKPSGYSYEYKGMLYLEEDCDAGLFLEAKKAAGEEYEIVKVYEENTKIRNYPHVKEAVCLLWSDAKITLSTISTLVKAYPEIIHVEHKED